MSFIRHNQIVVGILWLIAGLGVSGCATPGQGISSSSSSSSSLQRVRPTWWNNYRQGLASMQQRDYERAITAFEAATGLHNNDLLVAGQDASRLRTYGLHFTAYYPIRELGICHYYLGNVELAKHYLARSLEQAPSQRAQEYLQTLTAGQPRRQG